MKTINKVFVYYGGWLAGVTLASTVGRLVFHPMKRMGVRKTKDVRTLDIVFSWSPKKLGAHVGLSIVGGVLGILGARNIVRNAVMREEILEEAMAVGQIQEDIIELYEKRRGGPPRTPVTPSDVAGYLVTPF